MKIKLFYILKSKDILEKLGSMKFDDGLTCYKIARNIKNINPELANFENIKKDLITKYGNKEGDNITVSQDNMDEYNKQINEILQQEIEINILPLSPEKLSGISPFDFLALDFMLVSEQT